MSQSHADGGLAFPVSDPAWLDCRTVEESKRAAAGMSLRDHFAGKALQGMLANPEDFTIESEDNRRANNWDDFAKCAYEAADAMIRARGAA